MKTIYALIFACFLFGCDEGDQSEKTNNSKQEAIMNEANRQVGMPAIVNFQERKLLKQILELRDQENLICYAYLFSEMTGKRIFIGKCLGYGLPHSSEFTNPWKGQGYSEHPYVVAQADPNGLFMPASAEATWLMLLDKKGEPHPVYVEPRVIVSPFPLED